MSTLDLRITVATVDGRTWASQWNGEPVTDEQVAASREMVQDWAGLTHITLEIEGVKWEFNPRNIVAVALETRPIEDGAV